MKKAACKAISFSLPLLGLLFAIRPAVATPYVDITADWSVGSFLFFPTGSPGTAGLPADLSVSCSGGASGGGAAGCSDSATLDQTVPSSQDLALDHVSGLTITNESASALTGTLYFTTMFSDFDPSDSLGVGVDSLTGETAGFSTAVSGTGVNSSHSCSLGAGPLEGCVLESGVGDAQYTEAVWSPDTSQEFTGIDLALAPGASDQLSYDISIAADFSVPEPSSLLLLAAGLTFFWLLLWRRCVA